MSQQKGRLFRSRWTAGKLKRTSAHSAKPLRNGKRTFQKYLRYLKDYRTRTIVTLAMHANAPERFSQLSILFRTEKYYDTEAKCMKKLWNLLKIFNLDTLKDAKAKVSIRGNNAN